MKAHISNTLVVLTGYEASVIMENVTPNIVFHGRRFVSKLSVDDEFCKVN